MGSDGAHKLLGRLDHDYLVGSFRFENANGFRRCDWYCDYDHLRLLRHHDTYRKPHREAGGDAIVNNDGDFARDTRGFSSTAIDKAASLGLCLLTSYLATKPSFPLYFWSASAIFRPASRLFSNIP